ncbi:hypothetical protein PybrP1_001831 [[Pythium] brassicae (nom. inval.)]|nr:hypothetical protein PybrP1_001831 [[Pythium] brassicae (nom. inval.)]
MPTRCRQREIYYLHPFFKSQQEADEAILGAAGAVYAGSILGVPRSCLNVVGATKGCFAGRISVQVSCCDARWSLVCLASLMMSVLSGRNAGNGSTAGLAKSTRSHSSCCTSSRTRCETRVCAGLTSPSSDEISSAVQHQRRAVHRHRREGWCVARHIQSTEVLLLLVGGHWGSKRHCYCAVNRNLFALVRWKPLLAWGKVNELIFVNCGSRAFVSFLRRVLDVPVIGLCDCNPFGVSIMVELLWIAAISHLLAQAHDESECICSSHTSWDQRGCRSRRILSVRASTHSSIRQSSQAKLNSRCSFQVVDVKWLGLRPSQIRSLDLPPTSFKPLTQRDLSAANSLARYPFVQVRLSCFPDPIEVRTLIWSNAGEPTLPGGDLCVDGLDVPVEDRVGGTPLPRLQLLDGVHLSGDFG